MDLAPEYMDLVNSQSPQPNLQEVLFVMGGRSLDDSDDDSDEDEDRDPRLQRLLPRNCAFYNTRTSTNIPDPYRKSSSLFKFKIHFTTEICWEMSVRFPRNSLADVSQVIKCSADRKTALQECGLDVTKLDHHLSSSNEGFIVQSWKKVPMSMFFIRHVKEEF